MKNTKLKFDELKNSNVELIEEKKLMAIKGGVGDPPPFGVIKRL